jgi:signal transduction histidine kinase
VSISPIDVARIAAVSGGYALGAGALLWVLTTPVRRHSLRAALLVQGLICLGATIAGVLGTAHAMFLSQHDLYVTTVVAFVVAIVVSGAALLLSRQISREHGSLRDAAAALGAGGDPAGGPDAGRQGRLAAEAEQVRRSLVEAGRALAESRARERAMVAAQQEMFAAMSHDLRTPMAGIRAMAESLEDGVAPDPARYHSRIRVEVDRLAGMVDALFELARPGEHVAAATDTGPVPLADIVSDCLAGLDAVARSREVSLTGRARGDMELTGDPSAIARAVGNVVTNALAATPTGGSVEVVLERIPGRLGAASTARLTVSDTCGGIDHADLPRVFDVGFRGSRPVDRARAAPGGAGLGLAVTRRIVEAHHGTVTVENTALGCAFCLELPLDEEPCSGAAPHPGAAPSSVGRQASSAFANSAMPSAKGTTGSQPSSS